MTSEIKQTTFYAGRCNGPTNRRSNCLETKSRESYFDHHEKCKNRLKAGGSVF